MTNYSLIFSVLHKETVTTARKNAQINIHSEVTWELLLHSLTDLQWCKIYMMMLHGTKNSDSPIVESRPKEMALLPPLSTNRKCIQKCDSVDDDSDDESRASQFLTTRWRSKPKKGHDRLTVNQSSMSDSFVLPRINGSSQSSNTEHHDRTTRKSRTSLSFPTRTRDTCIPLSKSCPALMNNTWRRSSRVGDTPDGYEDDDEDEDEFTDSESSPRDLQSRSHNSELLRVRRSNAQIDENCNHRDDITDGVVRKLAKLESPRGKHNHLQGKDCHHPKTKESETKLPDIFNNPNGLSQQLFKCPDQCDKSSSQTSQGRTRHGNIKSKSHGKGKEPEFRVPASVEGVRDNSFDMGCSPWDANGKSEAAQPPNDNASDRQSNYSKPSTRVAKKKRKQQKRQRTNEQLDRPNLIRDVSQADIKCRNWLVEGHQENAPKLATSEQPEVV